MNIISLDIGSKRIGMAITDLETKVPRSLATIYVKEDTPERIKQLIQEHEVDKVVIGMPRNMDGEKTKQSKDIEEYVDSLELGVDIEWQDESLTSKKAEEELGSNQQREAIDSLAAIYILEDYLRSL